jgi:hypothetical protein
MTTWLESSSTERPQWRPETDTVTSHGRAVVLLEWESDFALLREPLILESAEESSEERE